MMLGKLLDALRLSHRFLVEPTTDGGFIFNKLGIYAGLSLSLLTSLSC
jgi:hypothetical protein